MKTVEEHNNERYRFLYDQQHAKVKAGVACNTCKEELILPEPNVTYTSYPPQQKVYCPRCKLYSFMVI